MDYLNTSTLKIFMYLLLGQSKFCTSFLESIEIKSFINDIINNKLDGLFLFKPNKNYVTENLERYKSVYNDITSNLNGETTEENIYLKKIFDVFIKNIDGNIKFIDLVKAPYKIFDNFVNSSIEIHFNNARKEKLLEFLNLYIDDFENDHLTSLEYNYYSFKKNIEEIIKFLAEYSSNYGNRFNIILPFHETETERLFEKSFRICESLFYLIIKEFIKVNNIDINSTMTRKANKYIVFANAFNINLTLNKSIPEIKDILGYWTSYGGIKINEKDGIAYYKNNKYPFRSAKTKTFQLLCYLVKNHGKKIPVTGAYDAIWPEPENVKDNYKKQIIKDNIKVIKNNLKISSDIKPTLNFILTGNYIMLISNSP